MKNLFLFLILSPLLTLSPVEGRAEADFHVQQERLEGQPAVQALAEAASATPDLTGTPEAVKSASDAQMAPVTGKPVTAQPMIVVPEIEDQNRYYNGTVKHDAGKGRDIAVTVVHKPMRWLASAAKLPFAAIGGVLGGLYGASRAVFAKDDDDHNNNVGAGFMLGASAFGRVAGKVFETIFSIPVIVAGAIGGLFGGLVGLVRGLFKKD